MIFSLKKTTLALAVLGTLAGAHATPLLMNSMTAVVDQVPASFGGTLLDSAITNINNISYTGIARSAVYRTETGLDFYYQFSSAPTSVNGIARFTGYNFSALSSSPIEVFQTGAAFGIFSAGTVTSDMADRTNLGVIGFNFMPDGTPKVNPGTSSFTQIIRTNATHYTAGTFGLLNGIGDNARAFAPAVPEPQTYAMLLAGLGMIGTIIRRRRANNQA
ncbi:MAG: PEPxxWA-CTERM sorting domain-containing protein [Rhodoferax sp.]|nr:PEPxxWA-CTERM sorting domain-containing protein [Rhodoferax sp.]